MKTDRGATSERLELGVADRAVFFHLDLQFDHVPAARFSNDCRPDPRVVLVEGTDVAWVVEMVMHGLVVCAHHGAHPEPDTASESKHCTPRGLSRT
jgi:hypothetical protein